MIDKLVKFARQQYPGVAVLTDEQLTALFETHKETTIVRTDKQTGEITGFTVFEYAGREVRFLGAAMIGDPRENFRDMRRVLRLFKGRQLKFTR